MFRTLLISASLTAGLLALVLSVAAEDKAAKKYMVYVGTYTGGKKSEGIYRMEFDPDTGKLGDLKLAGKTANPSFLAIHPTGKFLYAVGEMGDSPKKGTGAVNAFAIDPKTGDLTRLNGQSSEGAGPCHIVVDKAGKHAFVANYSGGNACALPIDEEGKLGKATSVTPEQKDVKKKKRPLGHSINLDAANKFAFVGDAGLDKVFIYKFSEGKLTPNDPPYAHVGRSAAPRHFAFHPNGKNAYAINERELSISVFDYDAEKGALEEIQAIATPGTGPRTGWSTAEVVVHPTGKFVYGSNRAGENSSIAVFSVDEKTGRLTYVENQGKGVNTPRNFAVDPTGKWCFVGNQGSDTLILFSIDQKTGKLKPTETKVKIGQPVCIRFLAWGK